MMNKKQQLAQDEYLLRLLGDKCDFGYHSQGATHVRGNSTLGRKIQTVVVPESRRKAQLEAD